MGWSQDPVWLPLALFLPLDCLPSTAELYLGIGLGPLPNLDSVAHPNSLEPLVSLVERVAVRVGGSRFREEPGTCPFGFLR